MHEIDTHKPWWARWSRRKILLAAILTPAVFLGAPLLVLVAIHLLQPAPAIVPAPAAAPVVPAPRPAPVSTPAAATAPPLPVQPVAQAVPEPLKIAFDALVEPLGNGHALVFGGRDYDRPLPDAFMLDLATLTMIRVQSMKQSRDMHQSLHLADGSVLALGGFQSWKTTPAQSNASMPTERWDPQTQTWTALPGLDIAERDYEKPVLLLADGRILGFEGLKRPEVSVDYVATELSRAWIWDPVSHARSYLSKIPSEREKFSVVQLDAARIALIGGNTPRDVVAMERQCATCSEEYLPFGDTLPSNSTDVFDLAAGRWSAGPTTSHAGGTAIRLRDGRVFKLSLVTIAEDPSPATDLLAEVSDRQFSEWTRAGRVRVDSVLIGQPLRMIETHDGVAIFISPEHAFLWSAGKLARWKVEKAWFDAYALDDRHVLLNAIETDQYLNRRPVPQIVETP